MSTITAAVHNNAVWCDSVCRALGCDTTWADGMWVNRSPAPPYYSNAVTVDPIATAGQLERIERMLRSALPRPWTIKDGYGVLDLVTLAFGILFTARWISLPADRQVTGSVLPGVRWMPVADDAGLGTWELAWRGANEAADAAGVARMFAPSLLADPDIRFLAAWEAQRIVAVAIANRSDDGSGPVVGISNIVLGGDDPERYRSGAVAAVRDAFPGLPMVGYERGDDLNAMRSLGFRSVGALRVWISPT